MIGKKIVTVTFENVCYLTCKILGFRITEMLSAGRSTIFITDVCVIFLVECFFLAEI